MAPVENPSMPDRESSLLADNQKFIALIEQSRRSYREEGGICIEDRCQLGLKRKARPKATRPARKRT